MEEAKKENIAELKWYFRPWAIAAAIFGFGPLGLILLWFRPRTGIRLKVLVSVLVGIATVWMTVETTKYYQQLMLHYKELAEVMSSM
jgi:hypothetical protein